MKQLVSVKQWVGRNNKADVLCDYFIADNGKRFKFNPVLVSELAFCQNVDLSDLDSVAGFICTEVENNQALYDGDSYLVQTVVTQSLGSQYRTLESFIHVTIKNSNIDNPPQLELKASEWLMFARASAFASDLPMAQAVLVDGVDIHAHKILNDIHGYFIQGVKCIVKENDVSFLQWVENEQGQLVWENTLL